MLRDGRHRVKAKVYPKPTMIMDDDVVVIITTIQKIYNQIHEGFGLVDEAFGIQLIFLIMQQFVMMTTIMYYCVSNMIKYILII